MGNGFIDVDELAPRAKKEPTPHEAWSSILGGKSGG